jgi:hypothetical protein
VVKSVLRFRVEIRPMVERIFDADTLNVRKPDFASSIPNVARNGRSI